MRRSGFSALLLSMALLAGGCGSDDDDGTQATVTVDAGEPTTGSTGSTGSIGSTGSLDEPEPQSVSLLTYDSFPTKDTTLNEALAEFTAETGIAVRILLAGDAGTMVSKAELTAGNPEGDVMWGVDNTLLSRAISAEVFAPYTSSEVPALDARLVALAPGHEVTPVDFGDVCVNYDIGWFEEHAVDPPTSLADLTDPRYSDLLVVEDPAASSPGLAFVLATVAEYGVDGWQEFWRSLRTNGVEVVESWNSAYYERFSGSGGSGDRPLVVSYGTSPAAEVVFADPPRNDAPTAAVAGTCFRQVEFAGVLRGTANEQAARALVDFLAGKRFQEEVALNLFVYPARTDVELPAVFTDHGIAPTAPYSLPPTEITAHREEWVDEWTQIVLR